MKSLYISRVFIKNFRNFKNIDVNLDHKQVIIGENNVGKTNFLKALQLILDPTLSDEERMLEESDFFDGIENPMENDETIEIQIFISNYEHLKNVLAQLSDATIDLNGQKVLKITYKFYPELKDDGTKEYKYIIFKGNDEQNLFTYEDRKYLQIKVIKAIRDVETELKNSRNSPINKLLKRYDINKEDLEEIAENLKEKSADILNLDEVIDLQNNINQRFSKVIGIESDLNISLKTIDIEPSKLLSSLKLLMSNRQTGDTSLGINNILYISLILLLIKDTTIPTFLKKSKYDELSTKSGGAILGSVYEKNDKGNYFLKSGLNKKVESKLYDFFYKNDPKCDGVTILAIEEPEAHLHPTLQRLIYRDVIRDNDTSVLLTTHSTHITSIAPLKSIVHLCKRSNGETRVSSTANLSLTTEEFNDLERYIDVKRGEIYLGKGVILVEGIAEEYMIPSFATILGKPLDEKGIIVCNINSTNFKPYVKFLDELSIPYVVVTDGDFYYINSDNTRDYHLVYNKNDKRDFGYLGHEVISSLLIDLGKIQNSDLPKDFTEQYEFFKKYGIFVGNYTFEIDIMFACANDAPAKKILCDVFNDLTSGGKTQKQNFKNELDSGEFRACLNKLENNNIGKGRFAQRFSMNCVKEHIPGYIAEAINAIYKKVDEC